MAPHADLVVSAKAPIERLATFARERGWRHLRLVSSAGRLDARDYGGEVDGQQQPMMNVFERDGAVIRHFWGSEMLYAPSDPGQDPRHMGTLEPSWNLFDLMRTGRGEDWDEQFDYDCCR